MTRTKAWALLLVAGCQPAAGPPPRPPAPPAPAPAAPPVPHPAPAPAPVVEPADARMPLSRYRAALEPRLLTGSQRLLPMALEAPGSAPIGHAVVTLGDPSGRPPYRMVTIGFGRRAQPHHFGTTPRYVELLAESDREGAAILHVLSELGRFLHAPERPISVRFQAFDAIRVDESILGERFFVLVPGGEVAVSDELTVTILRVIPMEEGDFIHMNMRGDGAVRAWWSEHRGSPGLLRRWDRVLGGSTPGRAPG